MSTEKTRRTVLAGVGSVTAITGLAGCTDLGILNGDENGEGDNGEDNGGDNGENGDNGEEYVDPTELEPLEPEEEMFFGFDPGEINQLYIDGSIAPVQDPDEDEKYDGRIVTALETGDTLELLVDGSDDLGQSEEIGLLSTAIDFEMDPESFGDEYDKVEIELWTEEYIVTFDVTVDAVETLDNERDDEDVDISDAFSNYRETILATVENIEDERGR